jgi:hypothetical protein
MANEGYGMHEEYIVEVLSKGWISGNKLWLVVGWDPDEIYSKGGNEGYIYAAESQFWVVLCQTKVAVSISRLLMRLY